ncbi:flagellar basal body L-ring protein FlgH, partial [Roseisolibacter sp. H3M3-2]|uniref:flagellar basal body L-ring protein FlgH n=1 Tax=Roseisolibacter sp. H3M3-2 TaxID=3031323 RepID=UPI0023D9B477
RGAAPAAVPAAPAAPAWTPTPAANRPGMGSWLGDRRAFAVGDIITVLVDDYTISSAVKDDLAQQRRTRDLGASVDINSGSKPTSIDARIGTRNDGNTQQRGEARRENRFQSEMSVRIVAAGPNDTYQVRGTRLIDVDKGKQDVVVTGWVRAQDVSTNNTVESARLADAQIAYQSPGPLGKTKSGLLTRIVGLVWP